MICLFYLNLIPVSEYFEIYIVSNSFPRFRRYSIIIDVFVETTITKEYFGA